MLVVQCLSIIPDNTEIGKRDAKAIESVLVEPEGSARP
jgi:hypothetical protein